MRFLGHTGRDAQDAQAVGSDRRQLNEELLTRLLELESSLHGGHLRLPTDRLGLAQPFSLVDGGSFRGNQPSAFIGAGCKERVESGSGAAHCGLGRCEPHADVATLAGQLDEALGKSCELDVEMCELRLVEIAADLGRSALVLSRARLRQLPITLPADVVT